MRQITAGELVLAAAIGLWAYVLHWAGGQGLAPAMALAVVGMAVVGVMGLGSWTGWRRFGAGVPTGPLVLGALVGPLHLMLPPVFGIGLAGHPAALALVHGLSLTALSVLVLRMALRPLPEDLFDAARMEGQSDANVALHLVLQLIWPAPLALVIWGGSLVWAEATGPTQMGPLLLSAALVTALALLALKRAQRRLEP
ncbi:hypothetical protein [Gemmobacter denitrificans]|uniref:Uncharacterized protein n=1 Tax=Gemmobacter denitrificans TaxID=3123040 RepID=A0ABU8BSZ0_9RHOB